MSSSRPRVRWPHATVPALSLAALAVSCGGPPRAPVPPAAVTTESSDDTSPMGQESATPMMAAAESAESTFGPLEVGGDWASYQKMSRSPWISKTHGKRFVETYVNAVGAAAYASDAPFPVGTIIVKPSWENKAGLKTDVAGPIFVMRKEPAGYAPDHGDWSYAIHWADPTPAQRQVLGGPIYWRGTSEKVAYCMKCHDDYDREVGGIPVAHRAWGAK